MIDIPTNSASDGRDNKGRFAPGNRIGKGNPLGGRVQKLRVMLHEALTDTDFQEICEKLIEMAKGGDLVAIRELFDRLLGKSSSEVLLRTAVEEKQNEILNTIVDILIANVKDHETSSAIGEALQERFSNEQWS